MRVVSLDYETYFSKKEYSVAKQGNWRYAHDSRFDPYILSAFDGEEKWVGRPDDFNWESVRGDLAVAHNAGFERAITGRLIELGRAPEWLVDQQWQCTANMSSFLCNERALQNAVRVLENRNISKAARNDMNGRQWSELNSVEQERMKEYAVGDTVECRGLWMKYSDRWPAFERELSEITMRQCSRGVRVNVEKLESYIKILQEVLFNLERSLPWTERGRKPSSTIAIAEECRKVGIPAMPIKDEDEEAFNLWERTYGPIHPWVYGVGKWRSLNKLLGSLLVIQDRLRPDDTIDFSLLYFGAHTGRWSGGGAGLNMQNLRKQPLYIKNYQLIPPPEGLKKKEFAEWVLTQTDFQLDIRSLFIPRNGKKFILADLSQIEPRILAYLTNNKMMLDLLRGGMSIYEAFARSKMGWVGGVLKNEDPEKYGLSKIQVLGLGYGCAWEKFIAIAADYGIVLTEAQSRIMVADFRAGNTETTNMWADLDNAFQKSAGEDFIMELPSGRKMTYRGVERLSKMKKNKKTGKFEPRLVFTAEVAGRRKELYGGLLTENIVQATAREIFGYHLCELERGVSDVLFHVHDEALNEVDADVTPRDIEHVMSMTPDWMPGLPCSAEANEVPHYTKM